MKFKIYVFIIKFLKFCRLELIILKIDFYKNKLLKTSNFLLKFIILNFKMPINYLKCF